MSDAIGPVSRALRVLEALNLRYVSSIEDLHGDTGLPKPTLVRLLRALMADGYVDRVSRQEGYRLAPRILALTAGYRPRDLLIDAARPLMDRFTQKFKWPLYLATLEDLAMRVRYSTATLSPVAPDHASGYNMRFSLVVSAFGKVYLAFCSRTERRQLLASIIGAADIQDGVVRDKASIDALLAEVAEKGYATTGALLGDRGRGMAVPLRSGRRVIGGISMRHYRSSLSEDEAARRYLEPMRQLAAAVGRELTRTKTPNDIRLGEKSK